MNSNKMQKLKGQRQNFATITYPGSNYDQTVPRKEHPRRDPCTDNAAIPKLEALLRGEQKHGQFLERIMVFCNLTNVETFASI